MVDAWPGTLPQQVLQDNYSEGVADGLLEYQPDTGPTMTRLRTSANARSIAIMFEMTSAQLQTLLTFVNTTLIGGSLPFHFPGVIENTTYLVKFQKAGLPKWTALGGDYYSVAMSIWVLP